LERRRGPELPVGHEREAPHQPELPIFVQRSEKGWQRNDRRHPDNAQRQQATPQTTALRQPEAPARRLLCLIRHAALQDLF
jgi:hypothetical protein